MPRAKRWQAVAPLDFLVGQIDEHAPLTLPLWAGGPRLAAPAARRPRYGRARMGLCHGVRDPGRERQQPCGLPVARLHLAVRRGRRRSRVVVRRSRGSPGCGRRLSRSCLPAALRSHRSRCRCCRSASTLPTRAPLARRRPPRRSKSWGSSASSTPTCTAGTSIVDTVAAASGRLSPEEQAAARIFAPDYGVAGAIELLGRRRGLPAAISGHNNYWLWGPRGWDGTRRDRRRRHGGTAEAALRVRRTSRHHDCGLCMPYENNRPVWIAAACVRPWREVWPLLKHYD